MIAELSRRADLASASRLAGMGRGIDPARTGGPFSRGAAGAVSPDVVA